MFVFVFFYWCSSPVADEGGLEHLRLSMYSCWEAASTAANTLSSSHSDKPRNKGRNLKALFLWHSIVITLAKKHRGLDKAFFAFLI